MKGVAGVLLSAACLVAGLAAGCGAGGSKSSLEAAPPSGTRAADPATTWVVTASDGSTTTCIRWPNAEICRSSALVGVRAPMPPGAAKIRGPVVVRATVLAWNEEEGWGVLAAPAIAPGGVWVHFSAIKMEGYRSLAPGQVVRAAVIGPLPYDYEGYRFEATSVRPLP